MKLIATKGATSQTCYVFIRDSSLTTGLGLTGLAYNSGSLVGSYVRPLGSRTAITLATQTVTGAWSSGGFVEVDATNMPGVYRFDIPDAVFATGVDSSIVMLKGATNMEPVLIEFQLIGANLQDAVHLGITGIPNAAAGASGGLLISGTNAGTTTLGALTITGATTHTGATTYTGAVTASNASNNFRVNGAVPGASGGLFIAGTNAATAVTTSFTTTFTGNLTGSVASVSGAVGSVTGAVASVTGNVGGNVTGSVGSVLGGIDTTSGTTKTFDALQTAMNSAHGAGSWATATGFSTHSASDVWSVGSRVLTANTNLNDPTAAAIADAVWDEAISGHAVSGSTGEALSAAGAAGDPWITALPGSYSSGQAGKIVGDYLDAAISSVSGLDAAGVRAALGMASADLDTQLDAIKADTAAILTDTGTTLDAALAVVDANVDAIKAKTDSLTFTVANQIDANVLDWKSSTAPAMTGDAFARLGAPAGASVSADVAAVKADTAATLADTAEIGTAGAGLTALASAADLATVDANVDSILDDTGTSGVVVASASKTGYQLSSTGVDDILDEVVEGSTTLRQSVRLANSALGGKASGLETTSAVFRDLADSKDRITATVDADGNRTAVTRDLT